MLGSYGDRERADDLTAAELVERLRLSSRDLIADIYSIALNQIEIEDRRESNLNSKATALLAASGLSVTAVFTFGAVLLEKLEAFQSGRFAGFLVVVYVLSLLVGLIASLLAVKALQVRKGFRGIDERDVFNEEVLGVADSQAGPEGAAAAEYRRFMSAHLWQIYRSSFWNHEEVAKTIKVGQDVYAVFLSLVCMLGILIGAYAVFGAAVKPATLAGESWPFGAAELERSESLSRPESRSSHEGPMLICN